MGVVTIFLLVFAGFIVGIFFISFLTGGERADVTLYESIIMDLHKQLEEANETIFTLSNEKANLQDTITILEGKK